MIKDYPNIKKKSERTRLKSKNVGKTAMVATCNDSDSSESESENEEMANLCLMVRDNSREIDESKEITLEYLLTFTKEFLGQGILKVCSM